MWRVGLMCSFIVCGCEPIAPSGDLWGPGIQEQEIEEDAVQEEDTVQEETPKVENEAPEGFDFEGEDRPKEDTGRAQKAVDALALQAQMLGIKKPDTADDEAPNEGRDGGEPDETEEELSAPAFVGSSWGVHLVSTIMDASPPRAILQLPSGQETVVRPGMMLADHGLIIFSIEEGHVRIGHVQENGGSATIEEATLRALFSANTP